MTVTEITSLSPARARQSRKFSDVSNSNLSYNSSQFYVLLDQPNKRLWEFTDSECYNIKDNNLHRVHQALFLKYWICIKAGCEMNEHRQERHSRLTQSLPFANQKNHLDFLSSYPKSSVTRDILSLYVWGLRTPWGMGPTQSPTGANEESSGGILKLTCSQVTPSDGWSVLGLVNGDVGDSGMSATCNWPQFVLWSMQC